MTAILPCVEIGPADAEAAVVWLHGLGASGHDFEPIVPSLRLPGVRFVFPHAPRRPVTINGGLVMPSWYDITRLDGRGGGESEAHVRESAALVEALLQREGERGVKDERIIMAGFSQGGALALHVGMRHPRRLAGVLVLSGYEVLAATREAEASPENMDTPLLACHGAYDDVVPVARGRGAFDAHAPGRDAVWREFPIGHEVSPEEVAVVREWLHEHLP